MKLVRVHNVELYPNAGFADRVWDEDPDWDAFTKSARQVSERYSELLAGSSALLRSSLVRLFHGGRSPDASVHIEVHLDSPGSFESATVMLPEGVASWSGDLCSRLALEVQHQTCLVLAERLAVDLAAFETARTKVVDEGTGYIWHGPWKSAPGRRHRARLAQRITDSGFSELWIELASAGSDGVLGRSRSGLSGGSLAALKDAQGSLKWSGPAEVTCDALDQTGRSAEPLVAHVEDLSSDLPPSAEATPNSEALPGIVVTGFSSADPVRPAEVVIESSISGYPGLAPKSFKRALQQASGMADLLVPWWQESGWATLSIMFVIDKEHHRSTTHKDGRDLEVWISLYSNELDQKDGARQALEAIEKGLVLAARRARITPCAVPGDLRRAVLDESQPQIGPRED